VVSQHRQLVELTAVESSITPDHAVQGLPARRKRSRK
jgi:hypothetical protein